MSMVPGSPKEHFRQQQPVLESNFVVHVGIHNHLNLVQIKFSGNSDYKTISHIMVSIIRSPDSEI